MVGARVKPDAVVAVLRREDRVLVIRRGPEASMPGYWALLSGRIEPGESQEDALVREVDEEIGLRVVPVAKVWECDTDDGQYVLHWWTAEIASSGEMSLDAGEVGEARWVTANEYFRLEPTFDGDHEFFAHVLPRL
ncbi:NUDIX domain-containing protein [Actinopolymorpha sp. B17G11]|uniref:NUDIX domain-containing protein n=1 Tax=Actinopolymorpha sp. B17G11 TaxID=3160861 RepID=UPI0032E4961E